MFILIILILIIIYICVCKNQIEKYKNKIENFKDSKIPKLNNKIDFLKNKISRWKFKQNNIISFPRSGQHLIQRTLSKYHKFKNIPFTYCGFYDCCNTVPCLYNSFYQKNHDFNGKLFINPEWKYIYLYRKNKLENIEAYFRWKFKEKTYENEETYNKLLNFCKKHITYYNKLHDKYVLTKYDNILPIEFNSLLLNPEFYIKKILYFFNYNTSSIEISNFLKNNNEKIKKKNILNTKIYERLKKDLKL